MLVRRAISPRRSAACTRSRRVVRRRRRRTGRADRAERRGQDDLLQPDQRPARTRCRPRRRSAAHDVDRPRRAALARRGVGRTFQVAATFASMTVRENVEMALARARAGRDWLDADAGSRGFDAPPTRSSSASALADTRRPRTAATLAYGDAKRVELALALAGDAAAAADGRADRRHGAARCAATLMRVAADLARRDRVAVLFTEHDMDVVFGYRRPRDRARSRTRSSRAERRPRFAPTRGAGGVSRVRSSRPACRLKPDPHGWRRGSRIAVATSVSRPARETRRRGPSIRSSRILEADRAAAGTGPPALPARDACATRSG